MRYPAEETAEKHARILDQASALFRERGFSGVSVSDVMKAAGMTHGAFYNHFASKEDLISKSIDDASVRALAAMKDGLAPDEFIGRYVDTYLTPEHRDNRGQGCLIAALASEIAREPAAQAAFTRHVEGTIRSLAKGKSKNARRQAINTLSSIVGALVLARAVNSKTLSEEILNDVREALD